MSWTYDYETDCLIKSDNNRQQAYIVLIFADALASPSCTGDFQYTPITLLSSTPQMQCSSTDPVSTYTQPPHMHHCSQVRSSPLSALTLQPQVMCYQLLCKPTLKLYSVSTVLLITEWLIEQKPATEKESQLSEFNLLVAFQEYLIPISPAFLWKGHD